MNEINKTIKEMELSLETIEKLICKYEDIGISNRALNDTAYHLSEAINELYKIEQSDLDNINS